MAKTILIVDDFENTLFVTGFTLNSKGFNILKALSGEIALKYLDGREIHLIITDYNMPNMNGIELVKKIKEHANYQHVPIFILSTEVNAQLKDRAFNLGVTAWIKKPFKIEEFIKIVERAII